MLTSVYDSREHQMD